MTTATLSDIVTKVRKLTGTPNSQQLQDNTIIDYINSYYLYDFPAQFRSLKLEDMLTFNTIKNIDSYPFDFEHYDLIQSPVYIDKRLVNLYTSPWQFYGLFFNWQERERIALGDGANQGAFAYTVQNAPIIRSVNNNPIAQSVGNPTVPFNTGTYPSAFNEPNVARAQNLLIEANTTNGTLHVTDDGNGNLIGDVTSGSVNYETGAITNLQFTAAPENNQEITIHYSPAKPNRPQAMLFWQNQMVVRPVPDKGYTVEVVVQRRPSQVLLGSQDPNAPTNTGVPELLEWWETLAAGASKKIFEDRQDEGGIANMDKMIAERLSDNQTRTYAQLGKRRIGTMFADQLQGGGYNNYRFWGSNG